MKKIYKFLIICTLIGLLIASCAPTVGPDEPEGEIESTEEVAAEEESGEGIKETLVIANTSGEPGNLHPYNTISIAADLVSGPIIEPLLKLDDEGNPKPHLAESWDVEDLSITFHLREGVKFHNGDELTANDVAFSIKEVILNSFGGLLSLVDVVDVNNIEVIDDYTIKFNQIEPNSSLLTNFRQIKIVNQRAYEEMGEEYQYDPVGTGPYTLEEWVVGDHWTLKRFDEYWGGAAVTETIIIRNIGETAQAMIELETGGVDIINRPSGSDTLKVINGEVDGLIAVTSPAAITRNNNLNLNFNSEPINNLLVRQAIAHVIDREAWTPIISPGVGRPSYSMVAHGIWGYDFSLEENYPYPVDFEKAKELMIEAGYPDGFDAILLTDGRDYHQTSAQLIQNALAEIGINVEIQTMELAQQKEIMVTGEGFDMYMLDCVGSAADPLSALWRDVHPKFAGENSTHHHFYTVEDAQGQKFADLMDEIRVTTDPEEKLDLFIELQQVFTEDVVYIPINSIQGYVLSSDKVGGISLQNDLLDLTNLIYVSEP